MDESRKTLILRIIIMTCLVCSSWSFGRRMLFTPMESSGPLELYAYLYWMFFGPIVAGFYAGSTLRTYKSVLYVLLSTAVLVGFFFGFIDRFDNYLGEMLFSAGAHFIIFFPIMVIGVISAVAYRRLRVWWKHTGISIIH